MKMKSKILLAIGVVMLVVGATVGIWPRPEFFRTPLKDGAEFRVVQVTYTRRGSESNEHNIGSAPRWQFWAWRKLPKFLQAKVPFPENGIGYQGSFGPALSVWWTYIDPKTKQPELGPTDYAIVTTDSGDRIHANWPDPTDEGFRQIFITDPPKNSRRLKFRVMAWDDEWVDFSLENPAFEE